MTKELETYRNKDYQYISRGILSPNRIRLVELVVQFQDKTEKLYVRKKIPYDDKPEPNLYFIREVTFLAETQKTNLPFVKFINFDYPTPEQEGYITLEYMKGGNLQSIIDSHYRGLQQTFNVYSTSSQGALDKDIYAISSYSYPEIENIKFDNTEKMIIMYGLAYAIKFLHSKNILHRDIKPQNVLLDEEGYPHLSDFGLARQVFESKDCMLSGKKGTYLYMAQEVFTDENPDLRTDIYAFGVTVLMMLTGELQMIEKGKIFDPTIIKPERLVNKIIDGAQYVIPTDDRIPDCFKELISDCIKVNPIERKSIESIIEKFENGYYTFSDDFDVQKFQDYVRKIHN